MPLDIYFPEHIARTLVALDTASERTAAVACRDVELEPVRTYRQGYRDALLAVAVAFGVVSASPGEPTLHVLERIQ